MRLCFKCWHITTGEALFCNHCGATYDRKLCPRQHVNPRAAKVCSACGSKELSIPHPKVPLLVRPLILLLGLGPGYLLLIALVVYAVFYVRKLLENPAALLPIMCVGFVLGLLLLSWIVGREVLGGKSGRKDR